MPDDARLMPGPDHPLRFEPATTRWRARYENHVIADSDEAVVLREADFPAAVYFPREAVAMEYMSVSPRGSHCPYKGQATLYSLMMDGFLAEDAAKSYEAPYPAAEAIAGRIAFDRDKVKVYAVDDAALAAGERQVGEVIRHTDAGDGTAQAASWRPDRTS